MTVTIELEPHVAPAAVEALRSAARQRRAVAERAAGELQAEKAAGKDIRTGAVKVVALLGEADNLEHVAGRIASALEASTPQRPLIDTAALDAAANVTPIRSTFDEGVEGPDPADAEGE